MECQFERVYIMEKLKLSIGRKIILISVSLIMILVIILAGFFRFTVVELTSALSINNASNTGEELALRVDDYLKGYEIIVKSLAQQETIVKAERYEVESVLASFNANDPEIKYLYVGYENGDFFEGSGLEYPDYDPRVMNWYQDGKVGLNYSDDYFEDGESLVTVSYPIVDKKGTVVGVLGLDIEMDVISKMVENVKIGETGYPVIVDKNGVILSHPDQGYLGKTMEEQALMESISSRIDFIDYSSIEDGAKIKKHARFDYVERSEWAVISTYYYSDVDSIVKQIMQFIAVIAAIIVIVAVIIVTLFSKQLSKNIKILIEGMQEVSKGNLKVRPTVSSKDEIRVLGKHFNDTITELSQIVGGVVIVSDQLSETAEVMASTSEQVSASTEEVSQTIEEIAEGASSQAIDVEQGVVMIGELSKEIEMLDQNTSSMVQALKKSNQAYEIGIESIGALNEKSSQSECSRSSIEEVIISLNQHTLSIDKILDAISTIADQTNLLALNASIEAARAGEHGRGFAVVAEEIRKLAEESSKSSDEIRIIMKSIQGDSDMSLDAMRALKLNSTEQAQAVELVVRSFDLIQASYVQLTKSIDIIGSSVTSINDGKVLITSSIENISAISEQTAAASQEVTASMIQQSEAINAVARSAQELNNIAIKLHNDISRFEV